MREGFYRVDYQGVEGLGFAVIALDSGMVVGADVTGGNMMVIMSGTNRRDVLT